MVHVRFETKTTCTGLECLGWRYACACVCCGGASGDHGGGHLDGCYWDLGVATMYDGKRDVSEYSCAQRRWCRANLAQRLGNSDLSYRRSS